MNKKSYYLKIATNGQIVVPKEIRDYLKIIPGEQLKLSVSDNNQIIVSKKQLSDFNELRGCLKHLGGFDYRSALKKLNQEEMQ